MSEGDKQIAYVVGECIDALMRQLDVLALRLQMTSESMSQHLEDYPDLRQCWDDWCQENE